MDIPKLEAAPCHDVKKLSDIDRLLGELVLENSMLTPNESSPVYE